ncbi:MAG TPA: hypothetical protein VH643_17485 [Gemmataceae bacterium]|jgi:hypothetical protein
MSRNNPQKKLAILERRKNVAARYLRGQTQWEIARAFEVTQKTISLDLKAIQAEWLAQAVLDRGEWTARELARIDEVERQAWNAWTKSQETAETKREKTGDGKSETVTTSKGQAGDPRFLEIVLKCVAKRCELLGLNTPPAGGDDGNRNPIPDTESLRQLPLDELVRLHRASLGLQPSDH